MEGTAQTRGQLEQAVATEAAAAAQRGRRFSALGAASTLIALWRISSWHDRLVPLNHVALTVSDRELSAAFYGQHFGLTERVHDDEHLMILGCPDGSLVALSEGRVPDGLPRTNHFGFQLEDGDEVRGARERLRVEHNRHTLLVHLSDEGGKGWTVLAVDRATRGWAVAQGGRQVDAAEAAYKRLYSDA